MLRFIFLFLKGNRTFSTVWPEKYWKDTALNVKNDWNKISHPYEKMSPWPPLSSILHWSISDAAICTVQCQIKRLGVTRFVLPAVRPNQQLRACCLPAALPAATASTVLECSHAGPLFTLTEVRLVFTDTERNGPHIEDDRSCFGVCHNYHCSFISALWGTWKQNIWHVALPFSATLVTADRLPHSFLDVYCCCCGHWHHRICRWKKEECVKITGRKIWACITKTYKRNGKLELQEKGNVLVVKK